MGERYKKRFYLTRRLYSSGAPVIVESGALLYDARSNDALCQLVFRNIQDKPIKAFRAVVQCLDSAGEPLEKPVDHRYLDLDLKREEETGRESAIVLPNPEARSFSVRLSQVSFADGEVWTDEGAEWSPLPEPAELEDFCGSDEKTQKFRKRFGSDRREAPMETEELWFCACGAVNSMEEPRCHRCRCRRSALMSWSADYRGPEARDAAPDLIDEADEPGEQPLPRRMKRLIALAAGLFLLVGLIAVLVLPKAGRSEAPTAAPVAAIAAVPTADPREDAYNQAAALMDDGEYEQAEAAFLALGDYLDSAKQAQICRETLTFLQSSRLQEDYDAASALLESGSYSQARSAFLALGDYADSVELAQEAIYRKARALTQFVTEHDVKGVRAMLTTDPEAESLFFLPRERALALGSQGIHDLQVACGGDAFRFVTGDDPTVELVLLEDAVASLYSSLGDYKDSAEMAQRLPVMADRSDEFFALCQAGDLPAAKEWLDNYPGEFPERELWLERLDHYLPFCGDWELAEGDSTLLPLLADGEGRCVRVRCLVILDGEEAILRFLLNEEDETGPELRAEMDELRFHLKDGDLYYLALLTNVGNLSVAKYTNGNVVSGVVYTAATQ